MHDSTVTDAFSQVHQYTKDYERIAVERYKTDIYPVTYCDTRRKMTKRQ